MEILGPVKAYSTRSTKRTINKVSNLTAEKTKMGINTSNLLLKLTNYNSNLTDYEQLGKDTGRLDMAHIYDSTYVLHPIRL
jgi:carbohydrate-binding DOMON domain-containing protein